MFGGNNQQIIISFTCQRGSFLHWGCLIITTRPGAGAVAACGVGDAMTAGVLCGLHETHDNCSQLWCCVCVFNEFLLPILLLSELTHNLQEFILQPFFWKHNLITSAFYFSSDFLTHTPRLNWSFLLATVSDQYMSRLGFFLWLNGFITCMFLDVLMRRCSL